jgi:hypothetical protein
VESLSRANARDKHEFMDLILKESIITMHAPMNLQSGGRGSAYGA